MKKIWIPLLALLFILAACSENDAESEETEESVTTVEVGEITSGDLTIDKNFYGRSTPTQTTPVMAPMAGEVDSLDVSNGDQVEEDDVIMTIIGAETGQSFEIVAQSDGEVTSLTATEGAMVSNTDPVAVIADLEQLKIQVDVTAANLELFKKDEEVAIQFTGDEESSVATVDYIPSLPNESGLFPVELMLENEDNQWIAGMVAVLTLTEERMEDTLLIPTASLIEEGDESFVFLVEDDTVRKVLVTVTKTETDVTAIEAELEEGNEIVTSGQLTLSDGSKIKVANGGSES
ncbi:efflux RND transporter periplasmic adaptor subunit [Paraliobacillus sediminis]|uniref:efflux RND transporter periplasmic adaptor subunit n=1 Tax=Paraliobacillus sediminis TaxID=1885916 RepID=UPI000E3E6658|nr:efflux RND transporter periplasmic adaptor subunit [Paraliobacillus sediminis]